VNGGKILTPVLTLQAVFVRERLMAMGWTVKSATTGGITFATGENPRFLPAGRHSKKWWANPSLFADSLWDAALASWRRSVCTLSQRVPDTGLGTRLYFGGVRGNWATFFKATPPISATHLLCRWRTAPEGRTKKLSPRSHYLVTKTRHSGEKCAILVCAGGKREVERAT